ncbi:MAG TPA: hypothetical protein VL651_00365 [Bacteroidia bacterium]|nr:hypothetical protein [Bacteroidia bacterium]
MAAITLLIIASGCGPAAPNETADTLKRPGNDSPDKHSTEQHFQFASTISSNIRCTSLCDDDNGVLLDAGKVKQYGRMRPFNQDQDIIDDSIQVSFEVIDDCDEQFNGSAFLMKDTLMLQFSRAPFDSLAADCYCTYRMSYRFGLNQRNWKSIKVVRGK